MAQKRSKQTRRKSYRSKRRGGTLTATRYLIDAILGVFRSCKSRRGNGQQECGYQDSFGRSVKKNRNGDWVYSNTGEPMKSA
jgi:hypothetical protein